MSLPHAPAPSTPLTEKAVTAQAVELELLRHSVAVAQAAGGKPDPVLMAQFAATQRAFIEAKIQLEQMRKAGTLVAEPEEIVVEAVPLESIAKVKPEVAPEPLAEVAASPAVRLPIVVETSPAAQKSSRLLLASRVFWLLVMLLLTALVWFTYSRL
ncbi:MAG: hypothetical protein ABMA13_09785 [Chthoniobacteraceae bacterium]